MWKKTGRTYTGGSEEVFNLVNGGRNPAISAFGIFK